MIDFHYWPTPNGWKVAILLEELGLPYRLHLVNIGAGDQLKPDFLAISPNGRMPAIVDHDGAGAPVPVFESGAIMLYLAEKTGRFLPADPLGRKEALEWLFWQTGNQGPMAGQHSHFFNYAPEGQKREGYAFERYRRETVRCLDVLERRLTGRAWLAGDAYSIADMMCWPWALIMKAMEIPLDGHPNVADWRARVKARPAVQRGVALGAESRPTAPHDEKARKILFGG
ncbi:glutathione S-transferase N-terminal domain-containing protein [Pikeienuella sp. HZG-20]|uniref:glutathione S-transferase N-terminal domain-containing protein n=1 Tax=Paludibacillus litoralis TaxID=3133267 RepID=UPI0030EC5D6C